MTPSQISPQKNQNGANFGSLQNFHEKELSKFKETVLQHIDQINSQDDKGWTALHYAVNLKNIDAIDFLIECGIDVSIKNREGQVALELKWWS